MRRSAALIAILVLTLGLLAPAAAAADLVLAQEVGEDGANVDEQEQGGEETTGTTEDEGAGGEAAESGAGGESEGAAEETGPPWTYQMARLTLALLFLWGLVTVIQYYRMVVQRARERA